MACLTMCNRTLAQIELKLYCGSISCWALLCCTMPFAMLQYVVLGFKSPSTQVLHLILRSHSWKRQTKNGIKSEKLRLKPGKFYSEKLICVFIKCLPQSKESHKVLLTNAHIIIIFYRVWFFFFEFTLMQPFAIIKCLHGVNISEEMIKVVALFSMNSGFFFFSIAMYSKF